MRIGSSVQWKILQSKCPKTRNFLNVCPQPELSLKYVIVKSLFQSDVSLPAKYGFPSENDPLCW